MGVILLDTGVVVAFLSASDKHHEAASHAIRDAARRDSFLLSAVSYAELLTGARMGHRAEEVVKGFCERFVEEIAAVDERVADRAASLRAANKIKLPDALIMATAEMHPAQKVIGTDKRWARLRGCEVPFEALAS